jgi:hypothetical protein
MDKRTERKIDVRIEKLEPKKAPGAVWVGDGRF